MENKYIYSKLEIATYLRDFYRIALLSTSPQNKSTNFFQIYQKMLLNDGRLQYSTKDHYYSMVQIYEYMLVLKMLTILYDNKFNYLQESQIDDINISKEMFVNKKDYQRFSKKQIIKFIRNAFNHNDNHDKELIKFIRINENNQENIKAEIYLINTKPVPFHIILDLKDLISIVFEINKASTINLISHQSKEQIDITSLTVYQELDKMYLRKFFSRKKLISNEIKQISDFIQSKGKTKKYENELLQMGLEYKDYKYTTSQKVKIAEDLAYWEKLRVKGNDIIFHLINKVMPLSYMKIRTLMMNLCLADHYIKSESYSLIDLVKEAKKTLNNKVYNNESPLFWYIKNYGIDNNMLYETLDFDNLLSITDSIYYGYIFDSLVTDENIHVTSTKIIPREKIRNSFVHMRWFRGINECYKMFDWGNKLEDEFNNKSSTFWSSNITISDMLNCAEKYYQDKLKKRNEEEPFLEEPIHFRTQILPDDTNIIQGISFLKKSVFYFLSLNPNDIESVYKLYVIDNEQIQRLATEGEAKIFIEELPNLTDKEKSDYRELLEDIPSKIITASTKSHNKRK